MVFMSEPSAARQKSMPEPRQPNCELKHFVCLPSTLQALSCAEDKPRMPDLQCNTMHADRKHAPVDRNWDFSGFALTLLCESTLHWTALLQLYLMATSQLHQTSLLTSIYIVQLVHGLWASSVISTLCSGIQLARSCPLNLSGSG